MTRLRYVPPSLQSFFARAGAWNTAISPRFGSRQRYTSFATMTRSLSLPVQPIPGFAQCSVGSIDDVGTRNGCATSTSTASTTTVATTSVSTHSTIVRRTAGTVAGSRLVGAELFGAGAVGHRADAGAGHRLLRALVQPLAPAADGREEPVEVDLERREHRVGP